MRRSVFVLMFVLLFLPFLYDSTRAQVFDDSVTAVDYCSAFPGFCRDGGTFTLTISGACQTPEGDAVLTLTDSSGTGGTTAWYNVNVEGFDLGNVFNRNPADDLFDNALSLDGGAECEGPVTYQAVIPLASITGIAADGLIQTTLTSPAPNGIFDCDGDVTIEVQYDCEPTVSEPASVPTLNRWGLVFLVLVLLGSGLWIRRQT